MSRQLNKKLLNFRIKCLIIRLCSRSIAWKGVGVVYARKSKDVQLRKGIWIYY